MSEQSAETDVHDQCGKPWADHDDDGVQMLCPDDDVADTAHPCGHAEREQGCGGCDPGAVEYVRDDGGPWRRIIPPEGGAS